LLRQTVVAACALASLVTATAVYGAATIDRRIAVLRGLDKITAQTREIEVSIGQSIELGTLTITVRACRAAPPEDPPENAAFLEIVDTPPAQASRGVFSGWMFSSSPGVSALDHPVFDVWVERCVDISRAAEAAAVGEDIPDTSTVPLPQMKIIPPPLPDNRRIDLLIDQP
jgi:hypothetical protein